jgi:peptidyl-prolyl cis-trans isomerase C
MTEGKINYEELLSANHVTLDAIASESSTYPRDNSSEDGNDDEFNISVNGIKIEDSAILMEAQNHPAGSHTEALQKAAEALVVRQLLISEAEKLGLPIEPQKDQLGNIETSEDAVIRALIDCQVDVPTAANDECHRYYQSNKQKFSSEPLYEVRHILFSAKSDESEKRNNMRTKAIELNAHLRVHPEEFGDAARAYSDCPSREVSGNLGQLSRGSTVREFEQALVSMKQGEISAEPVESKFGFHIIALDKRIDGEILPFEAVKDRIAAWLGAVSWSRAVSQYISVLAGNADILGIQIDAANGPLVQ